MSHDEYLKSLFAELERLQPGKSAGLSHAIAYEDGVLYALVSMGDVRAKIRTQELDPDPIQMATAVIAMWHSSLNSDLVLD
jgi:uncharacterized cupin superfamily protein